MKKSIITIGLKIYLSTIFLLKFIFSKKKFNLIIDFSKSPQTLGDFIVFCIFSKLVSHKVNVLFLKYNKSLSRDANQYSLNYNRNFIKNIKKIYMKINKEKIKIIEKKNIYKIKNIIFYQRIIKKKRIYIFIYNVLPILWYFIPNKRNSFYIDLRQKQKKTKTIGISLRQANYDKKRNMKISDLKRILRIFKNNNINMKIEIFNKKKILLGSNFKNQNISFNEKIYDNLYLIFLKVIDCDLFICMQGDGLGVIRNHLKKPFIGFSEQYNFGKFKFQPWDLSKHFTYGDRNFKNKVQIIRNKLKYLLNNNLI